MRTVKVVIGVFLALLVLYLLGPAPDKPILNTHVSDLEIGLDQLDSEIIEAEQQFDLIAGSEAYIEWADSLKQKTEYSIVYLHGFSASHPEGEPLHINFAERYGCNLYLSRLYGHGLQNEEEPMITVTSDKLLTSAKRAIAIGKLIGEKVIVMATSTGATLALFLASGGDDIHSLILYSPNIDLLDESSKVLRYPWGIQVARLVTGGKYYEYDNQDNPGRRFWTNKYRLEAAQTVRLLVDETMKNSVFEEVTQPVFVGYYFKNDDEKDDAVSIPAILDMVDQLGTEKEKVRLVNFPNAKSHVISSHYTSKSWVEVQQETYLFAEEVLALRPQQPIGEDVVVASLQE